MCLGAFQPTAYQPDAFQNAAVTPAAEEGGGGWGWRTGHGDGWRYYQERAKRKARELEEASAKRLYEDLTEAAKQDELVAEALHSAMEDFASARGRKLDIIPVSEINWKRFIRSASAVQTMAELIVQEELDEEEAEAELLLM